MGSYYYGRAGRALCRNGYNHGMEIALCVLIGVVAGITGGLFGIGGGIIMVPALILGLGLSQHKAQGTSLMTFMFPVGILGVLNYYRAGNVDVKVGAMVACGFFVGAFLGSKVALGFDEGLLRKIFAGLLVVVAIQLFLKR